MRRIVVLLCFLSVQGFGQSIQSFHVTKVTAYPNDEGEPIPAGNSLIVPRWKVWGYTDTTEYVIACSEVQKEGKITSPCMPMSAGQTYLVKTLEPNAIGFPAEQSNPPEYSWYMIRQEEERVASPHQNETKQASRPETKRPNLSQCNGDITAWLDDRLNMSRLAMREIHLRSIELAECGSTYYQLLRWKEEPTASSPGKMSDLEAIEGLYDSELGYRYDSFLSRHGLLTQFYAEDDAGKR